MINKKDIFIINIGSLSSYASLYNTLGADISELRNLITKKKFPKQIFWDFRQLERKKIQVAALTYFLSVALNVRRFFEYPFKVIMEWDPYILEFLHDLDFIKIANYFDIFDWEEYIGGYLPGYFNPNSKLLFFDNTNNIFNFSGKSELDKWKEENREIIELELASRFEKILLINELDRNYNYLLIDKLISTAAELIVNTLLHGQEVSFIGIQRTSRGISISISDSGVGLVEGLQNYRQWAKKIKLKERFIDFNIKNEIDALINASLIKENEKGLKSAINDIINDLSGYVIMSSGIAEIRWEKYNWNIASSLFDYNVFHKELQSASKLLGEEKSGFLDKKEFYKGYYENHKIKLKGTRISFEILFKNKYLRMI